MPVVGARAVGEASLARWPGPATAAVPIMVPAAIQRAGVSSLFIAFSLNWIARRRSQHTSPAEAHRGIFDFKEKCLPTA